MIVFNKKIRGMHSVRWQDFITVKINKRSVRHNFFVLYNLPVGYWSRFRNIPPFTKKQNQQSQHCVNRLQENISIQVLTNSFEK